MVKKDDGDKPFWETVTVRTPFNAVGGGGKSACRS